MKKLFIKFVAASFSIVLIFSMIGPEYASAAETKRNTIEMDIPEVDVSKGNTPSKDGLTESDVSHDPETAAWWSGITKTALIKGLRYGGSTLGKFVGKLSPKGEKYVKQYSNQIANFLENLSDWQEKPIIAGLVGIGIPPDIAAEIAKYAVLVAGI